jgi:poly-gamma-glutamate capsule biosynthesis protein CapA/YwtB (metallophosphatase superfamily)
MKTLKLFVFLVIFLGVGVFFYLNPFQLHAKTEIKTSEKSEELSQDTLLTLIAVGDIMMGSNYPNESYLPAKDKLLLEPLHDILKRGDITFGNLEGTVLNSGGELKKCGDPSKCYAFRQPEYVVDQLKSAGFNLLSVANNHMGDFGQTGRANTQRVLKEKGIKHAGLESCPWDTMTVKGLKIGFTAFAPNTGCLQITDYAKAQEIVKLLDNMCDVVIVSFHGGAEGSSKTHITRSTEIFYGENRGNVYEFARKVIDAGADVVLGHGPHVTRAIDHYKGRFITYSMGNFCTYGQFNLKGISGMAPVFELTLKKDGTFVQGKVISTKQEGRGEPNLDPENGALEQIKTLTKQDIPELKVSYFDNGIFKF